MHRSAATGRGGSIAARCPILDLCRPLSVSDAALYALAVIHCPRDLDEQAKLFARLQNALIRKELNKLSDVPLDMMPRILQAAAGDNTFSERDNNLTSGAKVCAHMFMRVLVDGVSLRSVARELGDDLQASAVHLLGELARVPARGAPRRGLPFLANRPV